MSRAAFVRAALALALLGTAACSPMGDPRRRVAILLDEQVILSPQVEATARCDIGYPGGSTTITGRFSAAQAEELAVLIRGGALPVPVQIIEQRTVGPSLGRQAIEASAQAAIVGVAATILFIGAVYRLAALSLVAYGLVSYGVLLALGATLTLPGLAGFVLAIGMAVDANVLVFERAREEHARGRPLPGALRGGFSGAWSAIVDSNVTTLLAAGLLFFLASGPVPGFGVTLSVGVLASLFTALVLTRLLTEAVFGRRGKGRRWLAARPAWTGLAHAGWVRRTLQRRNPDLMGRQRRWLAVSALAVLLAVSGIAVRGLSFGVEFTGGRLVQYTLSEPVSVDRARLAVTEAGLPRAVVNEASGGAVSVRAGGFDNAAEARVREALARAGGGTVERQRDETIGPSLGNELRRNAVVAVAVALAAQLGYLALRFRWQWGAAAVLAMAHDVLVLVGAFAWLGKPVDGVFLAALLTVIGYSVNDSVVVFDRIRELVRDSRTRRGKRPLIGIGVGTYSSVFLATPLAVEFSRPK